MLGQGFEVSGLIYPGESLDNILHIKNELNLCPGDLLDTRSLQDALENAAPDYIFHLAALSEVNEARNCPTRTYEVNVLGQLNLLEAVRHTGLDPTVMVVGSALEYGVPDRLPVDEHASLRPAEPYASSKVAQDYMGKQYFISHDMKIVRVRPFNHTGPRRPGNYLCSSFARKIAEIESGKSAPLLKVGDPEYSRDITDVRDMVAAYLLAVQKCSPGKVYNICSGWAVKISEIINMLLELSGIEVELEIEPSLIRPGSAREIYGDCSLFRGETGWQPKIKIKKTLGDMLNYWREKRE